MNQLRKKPKSAVRTSIERTLFKKGFRYICGVDEVGYGALAGPVCIGCVLVDYDSFLKLAESDVNDSKKIAPRKRERLSEWIKKIVVDWSVSFVSNEVINDVNIKNATLFGARVAVELLRVAPEFVLLDGMHTAQQIVLPQRAIIRGDQRSKLIGAASIIGKVARDALMRKISEDFLPYGFERHKGYGTKFHCDALRQLGATEIHRTKFIDSII